MTNEECINECISYLDGYLGDERGESAKQSAMKAVREALTRRRRIDPERFKDRLRKASMSDLPRYRLVERYMLGDIDAGRYDGAEERPEAKAFLESNNLFDELRAIGVRDDSEDGYGYDRIGYYLNAVWMNTAITLDEIREFTSKMCDYISRMASPKTSDALTICSRSKILRKYSDPAEILKKTEESCDESKRLDAELERM